MPCKECSAGHMRLRKVTYYTWLANELITIPDFPAWVCDVCGRREYDQHALSQLNLILSPNAGRPPVSRKRLPNKRPTPKLKPRRP
ncbi:MAG: YgiT-type zinc finger protein [Longilinea sp.]|nr:YgiT-type zinc finger protein [Longilinea sp.]